MTRAIFTFDTTHHALWAEEVAREALIPHELIPAPAEANAKCNIAIETLPDQSGNLESTLAAADVPFRIYRRPE